MGWVRHREGIMVYKEERWRDRMVEDHEITLGTFGQSGGVDWDRRSKREWRPADGYHGLEVLS